ncbi:flavodoxin [Bifidobacterium saguini]|nr:flavodoxin [Bifidobacterium saguini]QTB91021.1 flavodoxin [Bifidobacterium saguini]
MLILRKTFAIAGTLVLSGAMLAGCGASQTSSVTGTTTHPNSNSQSADAAQQPISTSNALIFYFSMPEPTGTDTRAGASRVVRDGELYGNVELIANLIQQQTGADLFRIDTVQEYPADHDELIDFAVNEMNNNNEPELRNTIADLDSYSTVFIGFPIWNAQLPMPLHTLFDSYDFSGKTIVPFTVHGGSGFAGTIEQIKEFEPNATVIDNGFSVSRNDVGSADADLDAWIKSLEA